LILSYLTLKRIEGCVNWLAGNEWGGVSKAGELFKMNWMPPMACTPHKFSQKSNPLSFFPLFFCGPAYMIEFEKKGNNEYSGIFEAKVQV